VARVESLIFFLIIRTARKKTGAEDRSGADGCHAWAQEASKGTTRKGSRAISI